MYFRFIPKMQPFYKKLFDLPGWTDVQVSNKIVYGRDSVFLHAFDTQHFSENKITIGKTMQGIKKLIQNQDKIYVLNSSGISVYSISAE